MNVTKSQLVFIGFPSDFKLNSSLDIITMLSDQPDQEHTLIMSKVSTITINVNLDCTNFKFYWFGGFLFLTAIQNVNSSNEVKIARTLTLSFRYDQQSCSLICIIIQLSYTVRIPIF